MALQAIKTVGMIGLGKMGNPMVRLLAAKGFSVFGYDVSVDACKAVAGYGVTIAESPAKLAASCDLVIVVTGFEHQAEEALFGTNGVVAGARSGTIVGMASTISPSGMRDIASRLSALSLVSLDIPLCRGEPAAEDGTLLITGGGEKAAFELCRPAFETFADSIFHLGPVGAGQVGKMVNNLILWACVSANDEGLRLGEKYGVERQSMREMLLQSSGQNWALESGAGDRPMPWAEKDMMIVLAEADAMRMSLPLCGVIKEVIKGIKVARGE
jgi:3-hydroxyisobutyrate dehydrogenase-like beta-hydroxyacid dehydrogenase